MRTAYRLLASASIISTSVQHLEGQLKACKSVTSAPEVPNTVSAQCIQDHMVSVYIIHTLFRPLEAGRLLKLCQRSDLDFCQDRQLAGHA